MPALANLVVKKNDGVTDITYTGVAASAGDSSPAVWQSLTVGTAVAFHPELRITARPQGSGNRAVNIQFSYPYVVTGTDGISRVAKRWNVNPVSISVPTDMPDTEVAEAAAQFGHLMATALVVEIMKVGRSAT